ncbi:group I truncated hemoglobin [Paraferrimonas sedimenticola]|uniref:Hemoglobin n=1 Tax=Paraferrimonas sedimenticola TaxID=375674 RepID=A0AA37RWN8_9GAMM|nr:group 1 truncated hemoglobin [Paraferrimonas sedimenticola]GLP97070.1 hypothetical protein GCM10007895_23760 [Paraferrimonas sedimenticola]
MITEPLFDRLGGEDGMRKISSDIIDLHLVNPKIKDRYAGCKPEKLKEGLSTFLMQGTGGPQNYHGKDMRSAHEAMNIDDIEYMSMIDDMMKAFEMNGVEARERGEFLYILYCLRPLIVGQ